MAFPPATEIERQQDHASLVRASYLLTNLVSSCAVVFANKVVFSVLRFRFTVALTCIHTLATLATAKALCLAGIITPKPLPLRASTALAAAFTGYIVLCNVSLALNTVGFYQLTKIAVAPTVLVFESLAQQRAPNLRVCACVSLVCIGIGLATVADSSLVTNLTGMLVGVASVVVSAQYGVWIGSMTKHYDVSPLQLLEQYVPHASMMMALCVPVEGLLLAKVDAAAPTLMAFAYDARAVGLIATSALLGILVTFSTFLVIGSTSSLTYAVVGHVKTIVILGGGVILFGDSLAPVKALGVALALVGVVAYSVVKHHAGSSANRKRPGNDCVDGIEVRHSPSLVK